MISRKYKFHVLKRKIADFFEPPEILFLARSNAKIHNSFVWVVMLNLTIFNFVSVKTVFSFSEHRNLVNIRRRIIRWVVYDQLFDWRFLFVGYCPGARFSKVPIINGPGKLSPFTLKIEVQ